MAASPAGGPNGDLHVMILPNGQSHAETYQIDGNGGFRVGARAR